MLARFFEGKEEIGLFILRVIVGLTFMAHGSQKLFGMFGGGGIMGTAKFFGSVGIEPSILMAVLAGCAEFFGGLALVLGFFTRYGAIALMITMLVAMFVVHMPKGFFAYKGGYEYNLVLIGISIYLLFKGAGQYSLEKKFFNKEF